MNPLLEKYNTPPLDRINELKPAQRLANLAPHLNSCLGMGLLIRRSGVKLTILSILFTGLPLSALTKTQQKKDATYERQQHEYVLSTRNEVAAFCDPGDVLVKGSCDFKEESLRFESQRFLLDEPHPLPMQNVPMEAKEVSDHGRSGWSCRPVIVHPDQELRVTAALRCKKGDTEKVLVIEPTKTPGA